MAPETNIMAETASNPVVVVTGANRGIGLGICLRLVRQVCRPVPSDAFLRSAGGVPSHLPEGHWLHARGERVTIVLGCRDVDAGGRARERLLKAHTKEARRHAHTAIPQLEIIVRTLDLCHAASVLDFVAWMRDQYAYVSHLVCNAGIAPFVGIDTARLFAQYRTNFARAFSAPDFLVQRTGETSERDGLGLVWQSNFFGHYMLVHGMHELFTAYAARSGHRARVVWMSTLCAMPDDYSADDWQLLRTRKPYEGSKYQMQLVSNYFGSSGRESIEKTRATPSLNGKEHCEADSSPMHFLVQPGVVATGLDKLNSKGMSRVLRSVTLSMCRLFGSTNHTADPYKGAISAVHAMLVDVPSIKDDVQTPGYPSLRLNVKLNSKSALLHKEYVTVTECDEPWTVTEMEKARSLVENCDRLYDKLSGNAKEK